MRVTVDLPDDLAEWLMPWAQDRASMFDHVRSRPAALLYALRYARRMADIEEDEMIAATAAHFAQADHGQLHLPFPWERPEDDEIPF